MNKTEIPCEKSSKETDGIILLSRGEYVTGDTCGNVITSWRNCSLSCGRETEQVERAKQSEQPSWCRLRPNEADLICHTRAWHLILSTGPCRYPHFRIIRNWWFIHWLVQIGYFEFRINAINFYKRFSNSNGHNQGICCWKPFLRMEND